MWAILWRVGWVICHLDVVEQQMCPRHAPGRFLLTVAGITACFPLIEFTGDGCRGGKVHIVCVGVEELWGSEGIQMLCFTGCPVADRRGGWGEVVVLGVGRPMVVVWVTFLWEAVGQGIQGRRRSIILWSVGRRLSWRVATVKGARETGGIRRRSWSLEKGKPGNEKLGSKVWI